MSNIYDEIKINISRLNFLIDAIKKSQDKELIKEAKSVRKEIKIQLNAIKDDFESQETGLLDAITDE
jgi:hypothetical protein